MGGDEQTSSYLFVAWAFLLPPLMRDQGRDVNMYIKDDIKVIKCLANTCQYEWILGDPVNDGDLDIQFLLIHYPAHSNIGYIRMSW